MKKEELKALSSNSITDIDEESVTLTYDCGDADDAGRFESKAKAILDKSNIEYDITLSPSDPQDGDIWTVIDIIIMLDGLEVDINAFSEVLNLLDQI